MHVKVTNGTVDTYPYSVGQLRRDNPNTSFPKQIPDEMFASYGVFPVAVGVMPSIDDRTQKTEQPSTPSLVGDAWTIVWTTSSKTAEETQAWGDNLAATAREKRNTLLAATDYFALTDVPMSAEMTTYRQALRDITSHANFPNLVEADWPVKPA